MINAETLHKVLDKQVIEFVTSETYDEMKQDYELSYSEPVCQVLMFDEYVRKLSDLDLDEWFDDYLTEEELIQVRETVATGTSTYLDLNHKMLF